MTTVSFMSNSTIGNGQLRVSVIGAYTVNTATQRPYTVYRTLVRFQGECYERQLRYSAFRTFYNQLKFKQSKESIQAPFPPRVWLYRSTMSDRVIESRKVLLDEFMRQVCRKQLSEESEEMLMRLLRVGPFEDPQGRLSHRHRTSALKDPSRVDVIYENTEEESIETQSDRERKPLEVGTASIVYNSCIYPSMHSNAETVMTEDERSSSEVHSNEVGLMGQDGMDVRRNSHPIDSVAKEPDLPSTPPSTPTVGEEPLTGAEHSTNGHQEEEGKEAVDGLVVLKSPSSYADRVNETLNNIQHLLTEIKQAEEQVSLRVQPTTALTA